MVTGMTTDSETAGLGSDPAVCDACGAGFAARLFLGDHGRGTGELVVRDRRCAPCQNADMLRDPVGAGWAPLVAEAHARMSAIDPGYRIADLKQKLGRLRIVPYTAPGRSPADWPAVHAVAAEIEERSASVCQACGAGVRPVPRRASRTLCAACAGREADLRFGRFG
jgi:hypothetical protein